MSYLNEHLLPGTAGKLSLLIALIFVLVSTVFFLLYDRNKTNKKLYLFARNFYISHFILITFAVSALFYIIFKNYFEYHYVWKYSSLNTPVEYIISCFWAGQEGSFLFWIFVQGLIGLFLIFQIKSRHPIALVVFSLFQFLLLINIIGINVGSTTIGTSPFALLREASDDAVFLRADYLSFITDGNGLNPLLLNPWMVSHPPLIFIGYALTLIPFALIVSALQEKNYIDIIKPAIFWTVTNILFLGSGIIVGGAWAYEALTFGGFWAWDPIENASLVPWLLSLGALHLLIIVKKRRQYVMAAFSFVALSFWFVLYATFLTRSGILSQTSVHSFSNDSTSWSLIALLVAAPIIFIPLLIKRYNFFIQKENNNFLTRDFFLYLGAVILLLSSFQIIFSTSLPVFNNIFGSSLALPLNSESYYNIWQLPFAAIICILIALSQYLSFEENKLIPFLKKILLPSLLSLLITLGVVYAFKYTKFSYILLLFSSLVCVFFTLDLYLRFGKTITNLTAAIVHLGFGIFIFGIILTFSNKTNLRSNSGDRSESIILPKEKMVTAGPYGFVYSKNELIGNRLYFNVDVFEKQTNKLKPKFSLNPHIIINENMGNVYEPSILKFARKDIFIYISHVDIEQILSNDPYAFKETLEITINDTVHFTNTFLILEDFDVSGNADSELISFFGIKAQIKVHNPIGNDFLFTPTYKIINNIVQYEDAINEELGIKIRFKEVSNTPNTILIDIFELNPEYIVIKATIFPFINILWLGVIVMLSGLMISFFKHLKKVRKTTNL
ncbi:MAG: cytochrome c biogenesis protein CcsA [Bacteroidales bacterium]|nr:cytochrome c biogenesis protein CcsA [Bacteroidales bacterium]